MGAECSVPYPSQRALGKYHSKVSARLWGHLAGLHVLSSREPFGETGYISQESCKRGRALRGPGRAEKLADQGREGQGRSS